MNINGNDIEVSARNKYLIKNHEVLTLRFAEFRPGIGLWAFWFNDESGQNAGLFLEDELLPKVAERLKAIGAAQSGKGE